MKRPKSREPEFLLSIGGTTGHLVFARAPEPFLAQVRERYGSFTMPPAPGVDRRFSLRLRFEPDQAPASRKGDRTAQYPAEVEAHPLKVTATEHAIKIDRWDIHVRLAAKTTRGRTQWTGTGRVRMNPYALDCVLRVIWSVLLPREDGLLVHSCGLRHAEIGVVFPGGSGQGKSTLARKAPDADDVLSDELIAIRRTPDDAGWRVHGTPFWGDFARGGISMRSWPLRALAFLAQRDRVVMSPVTSSEAMLRLLSCMLCFQTDRVTVERNLALVARLCQDVRSVEAQLTRSASTAEIFGKLTPHLGPDIDRCMPTYNTREMISEFRSFLRKHRLYAFSPRGAALRPFLKPGASLLIEIAAKDQVDVGDVVLYWTPGHTPDDDVLHCERVGTTKRHAGVHSELLGKVSGVARDGRSVPMPGRIDSLARLFGAEVAMPILRLAGR
jgi:hypothetical protein